MRIALDARKLWDGGIGTYIRHLLGALAARPESHEWIALVAPRDLGSVRWPAGRVREVAVAARKYGLDEHVVVPRAARRAGADLLHEPHYTLPLGWRGPAVVTIHDLIHLSHARFFPPGAALYARAVASAAVRRARLVLADSEHTRGQILTLLGADPARVRVVPLGVPPGLARRPPEEVAAWRKTRALPADYLLYVGARKRHKNLPLLLDAVARITPPARPAVVLSGEPWRPEEPLARLAARLGLAGLVHFAGRMSDERDLACLYSGAALYVQPSLAEGFGLPPLEASACGVPVLSSNAGALPETLGDTGELLPPEDAEAWSAAIARLLTDRARREALVRAGLARAREFTFERTAAATLAVYEEAMRGPTSHPGEAAGEAGS
jgi:glycosyltransferase involved in cell wall biosynthesis